MVVSSDSLCSSGQHEERRLTGCNTPIRDFDDPKPCPYDTSTSAATACGLFMLYRLLRPIDPRAAEQYLIKSFKLIDDLMGECRTWKTMLEGDEVVWEEGGWETILEVSCAGSYSPLELTNGWRSTRRLMGTNSPQKGSSTMAFSASTSKNTRSADSTS